MAQFIGAPSMGTSAAVQDLGLNTDTMEKTQRELEEMKRRKKLMGAGGQAQPLGSLAASQLAGGV